MSKYLDYYFGLEGIVPSKQDDREGENVLAFRVLVDRTITPKILQTSAFPSKREVAVFVLQFFLSKSRV